MLITKAHGFKKERITVQDTSCHKVGEVDRHFEEIMSGIKTDTVMSAR